MGLLTDINMTDLPTRKSIARDHLSANELDKALEVYADILRDYPDDVEAYLVLGDMYRTGGDDSTAARLYASALRLDPQNPEIVRRIHLATPENHPPRPELGEPVPTHPMAIARLLQRLTGRSNPITETEIQKAAELLDKIINSPDPAQTVAEHLSVVDGLLPALIELNIRQARADGRPDLANALHDLQTNIQLQVQIGPSSTGKFVPKPSHPSQIRMMPQRFTGTVLLLTPGKPEITPRVRMIADSLAGSGCKVIISCESPEYARENVDLVITSNPQVSPEALEELAAYRASKIPVILDLEYDLEQMPVNHPHYSTLGLGSMASSRAFMTSLLLADVITVPSENLAISLQNTGYPSVIIPDGWSRQNALWDKPPYSRHTLNIGWVGLAGQQEDVLQIRRVMIRVMREFSHTQLVVASDPQVYKLFESLPEARHLFLPAVDYEDYPYMLGQMDLLVLPLRNVPYNRALSDRLLVEAGAKQIPWIASPIPAFVSWQAGGLIASTLDEWHTYLRQLILDGDLRDSLGRAGRQRAESRESKELGQCWQDLIKKVMQELANNPKEGGH